MSLDRDRNARIHSSRAAYLNPGRIVGNPYLGITSRLTVSQDLTGTRQPMCSAALKNNRFAVSGFKVAARGPATGRTSSVFP